MPRVSEQTFCANPKVSVHMITYNHEQFIAQAIESVLMQETEFEVELIIGADCSSDNTREIVKQYAREHPSVINAILHERNVGMHENGQSVCNACRGIYVAFLEGDDYWIDSRKLAMQVQMMEANPHYSMCGAKSRILEASKSGSEKDVGVLQPKKNKPYFSLSDFLDDYFLHTNTLMLRNGLVRQPMWPKDVANPDEFIIALHAEKGPVGFLNKDVSVYRLHVDGTWSAMAVGKRFRLNRRTFDVLNNYFEGRFVKIIRHRECRVAMAICRQLLEQGSDRDARIIFWETVPRLRRFKPLTLIFWGATIYGNRYIVKWHKFTKWAAIRTRIRRLTHLHLV